MLTFCGITYSHWTDNNWISGKVMTGKWKARIKIMKNLEGSYTDPYTGEVISEPTNLIAIGAAFPTMFKLTISVINSGSIKLHDIIVKDIIKNEVTIATVVPSQGTYTLSDLFQYEASNQEIVLDFSEIQWCVGILETGEEAYLEIFLHTCINPTGKFIPTSGDEGDSQEIEINEGAEVLVNSGLIKMSAKTEGVIIEIVDDNFLENGIGVIKTILPYTTTWAMDSCDTFPK